MSKERRSQVNVQGASISILSTDAGDYLSLTDMVQNFDGGSALIEQWLKAKDTILYLAAWESLNNPSFNSLEFEGIKAESGRNSFYLSIKRWITSTNAKGIKASAGRYGGTYAHKDIAFEFGTWLSPVFKLLIIVEFQRLKENEAQRESLDWNLNRTLSKLNYRIHTDAIKDCLATGVDKNLDGFTYATEADLLNVALFGMTSKKWKLDNPGKDGNMRDYASVKHLLVLTNLESTNAFLIHNGKDAKERLELLRKQAYQQLKSLGALDLQQLQNPPSLGIPDDEDDEPPTAMVPIS